MGAPRRLYEPRPVAVRAGGDRVPRAVAGVAVESVREEWVVEDRWWTTRPLRRHYFDLALADGRALTVFRVPPDARLHPLADACPPHANRRRGDGGGRWFRQRA